MCCCSSARDLVGWFKIVDIGFEDCETGNVGVVVGAEALLSAAGTGEEADEFVFLAAFVVALAAVAKSCLVQVCLQICSKWWRGTAEDVCILQ